MVVWRALYANQLLRYFVLGLYHYSQPKPVRVLLILKLKLNETRNLMGSVAEIHNVCFDTSFIAHCR